MLTLLSRSGRLFIAILFAVALAFGVQQVGASEAVFDCDTPTGVCSNNDDCDDACQTYNQTPYGGFCMPGGCCMCLE